MIYSWKAKWWTLPLQFYVRLWAHFFSKIEKYTPTVGKYLKFMKAGQPTQLKQMA